MIARLRSYADTGSRFAGWLMFYFAFLGFVLSGAAASVTGDAVHWSPALFCGQVAIMALLFARRS